MLIFLKSIAFLHDIVYNAFRIERCISMLIALSEYAKAHNKSGDTIRRLAEKGALKTAQKIGRNWVVDSEEPYPIDKRTIKSQLP